MPRKKEEVEEAVSQIENMKSEVGDPVLEFVSYGTDIFNLIAGGGAPFKRVINIVGDSSTGKSFLASELIAKARQEYGDSLEWIYDDSESGYSFNSKQIWGFDMITPQMPRSTTIEEFALNVDRAVEKLKSGKKLIYIVDSFDSLSSAAEIDEFEEKLEAVEKGKEIKGSYGQGKAKTTNQFFRTTINKINDKDVLLVIISQIRENLNAGMFGQKYYRAGGKSLEFYSAQVFWLAIAEKFERKGVPIGVCIQIKNTKNKTAKPYRHGFIEIIYDYGADNTASNIKYLYGLKTELGKDVGKLSKTTLNWDGSDFSYPELVEYIESENLEEELTRRVYKKWHDFEKEIATNGRKRRYE
jgi:recombination protein RecA